MVKARSVVGFLIGPIFLDCEGMTNQEPATFQRGEEINDLMASLDLRGV